MKPLSLIVFLVFVLLSGAAAAQGRPDNSGPGSSAGAGNRPDTSSGPSDRPSPARGADNRPDVPPGASNRGGIGQGRQTPLPEPAQNAPGRTLTDEDRALAAVREGRAVPLDRVLRQAQAATGGEMIDAKLLTVGAFLLYELRMLLPNGTVERMYYYSNTGNPVTTN